MRTLIVLPLLLALCACASRPYQSPGVPTVHGAPIDAAAYNREIERQGFRHYCGNGGCDALPRLIVGYAPRYPPAAMQAGRQGQATIVFTIKADGSTGDYRVESASADEFAEAAIQTLKHWRFAPATLRGKPVPMQSRQPFPFVFD
ncbi:energy transducer TonB [Pseudoxanthomonas mexicana]|uniref:energy transducer TonB n=1 Tax=Pseudoxanthomonas mexicana TaxID=128785 RepID=UPI00398B3A04